MEASIPCPFAYAKGKKCDGQIVRIELYHAELVWEIGEDGEWKFGHAPGTHYHLFCSKGGNHACIKRQDALKLFADELPGEVRRVVYAVRLVEGGHNK